MTEREITHRCDGWKEYGTEKCEAVRYSDGDIESNCGEPCSWIMGKSGHGIPPWKNLPGNIRCNPCAPDLGLSGVQS